MKTLRSTLLAVGSLLAPFCGLASASDVLKAPASVLVFPEFDSVPGQGTLITVTNTHPTVSVAVEFLFVDEDCLEFNVTRTLTPFDTFTMLSNAQNPNQERGYVVAFAKSVPNGAAIAFDFLIGTATHFEGLSGLAYSIEPYAFRASPAIAFGAATDVDGDGGRDLNGVEYEPCPDRLLFPRFLGQGNGFESDLVLIHLSGGSFFDAVVNLLLANDNTEKFSAQYAFQCTERVPLTAISGVFDNAFLKTTLHDPDEPIGAPAVETGFISIDGSSAASKATTIVDPAVLAFLIERTPTGTTASLPFGVGTQTNGDAPPPFGPLGDTSPLVDEARAATPASHP